MTDVAIIGGGAIGLSTAIFLTRRAPGVSVTIIDPDPRHRWSESWNSSGGVRQLFTCPENILLSQFTLEVIQDWASFTATATVSVPDLEWHGNGYLFLANSGQAQALQESLAIQQQHGVKAEWLESEEVAKRFPLLGTSDIEGAVLSTEDGWHSSPAFIRGLKLAVEGIGDVDIRRDRVVGLEMDGARVVAARGEMSGDVHAETFVNAAGCWAPEIAAWAGMPVPVEPMRRHEHIIEVADDVQMMPFIKDFGDMAIRPGDQPGTVQLGRVDWNEPAGFNYTLDPDYFNAEVQPRFLERFAALESCELRASWTGLYDRNTLDRNLIIGNRPGVAENLFIAAGLSGHGLMHAPGVGRALAELIIEGTYDSIDLSRFGYSRILEQQPYAERGIV